VSLTFGGHGIQPIDEVSGNAIYTSVTLDLSPTNVPDNNANKTQLLCVAGTVSPQLDSRLIYFRFKDSGGTQNAMLKYVVKTKLATNVQRSTNSSYARFNRYYQGNTGSTSSMAGERLSFIMFICEQSHDSQPYTNVHGHCWSATQYTSTNYHMIPARTAFITKEYGETAKLQIYANSNGIRANVRSWRWGGE